MCLISESVFRAILFLALSSERRGEAGLQKFVILCFHGLQPVFAFKGFQRYLPGRAHMCMQRLNLNNPTKYPNVCVEMVLFSFYRRLLFQKLFILIPNFNFDDITSILCNYYDSIAQFFTIYTFLVEHYNTKIIFLRYWNCTSHIQKSLVH